MFKLSTLRSGKRIWYSNRLRIFLNPNSRSSRNSDKNLASCVLHTVLRIEYPNRYTPTEICDNESSENGKIGPGECKHKKNIFEPVEQHGGN